MEWLGLEEERGEGRGGGGLEWLWGGMGRGNDELDGNE